MPKINSLYTILIFFTCCFICISSFGQDVSKRLNSKQNLEDSLIMDSSKLFHIILVLNTNDKSLGELQEIESIFWNSIPMNGQGHLFLFRDEKNNSNNPKFKGESIKSDAMFVSSLYLKFVQNDMSKEGDWIDVNNFKIVLESCSPKVFFKITEGYISKIQDIDRYFNDKFSDIQMAIQFSRQREILEDMNSKLATYDATNVMSPNDRHFIRVNFFAIDYGKSEFEVHNAAISMNTRSAGLGINYSRVFNLGKGGVCLTSGMNFLNRSGSTTVLLSDTTNSFINSTIILLNQGKIIEIPLSVGYLLSSGKISVETNLGWQLMMSFGNEVVGIWKSEQLISQSSNLHQVSLGSPMGSIVTSYSLSERFKVGLNMGFYGRQRWKLNNSIFEASSIDFEDKSRIRVGLTLSWNLN